MRGLEPVIKSSIFDGLAQFVARERLPLDIPRLMAEFGLDPNLTAQSPVYVPLDPVYPRDRLAFMRLLSPVQRRGLADYGLSPRSPDAPLPCEIVYGLVRGPDDAVPVSPWGIPG